MLLNPTMWMNLKKHMLSDTKEYILFDSIYVKFKTQQN